MEDKTYLADRRALQTGLMPILPAAMPHGPLAYRPRASTLPPPEGRGGREIAYCPASALPHPSLRTPPLMLGPSLDRLQLPDWADAVDLIWSGSFSSTCPALLAASRRQVGGHVADANGATLAHGPRAQS